ncbi:MAG: thioredoxin family protein [Actinomycetota bacterium]
MAKRQVEVFTAGCPVCEPAVQLVKETACSHCEVTVYNLNEQGADTARQYDLKTVPAVVVDGTLVSCCDNRGPNAEELRRVGIGRSVGA